MNPLERRRNLLAEDEYTSKFDYEKFEIEQADKEILISYEQDLRQQQMIYIKTNINIGKILFSAREKLKSYDNGTFMAWYEDLGFNKDSVSRFLKRYELYLKFPQKQQYISDIPVRLVTELTKKNVDEELVEEAINKEIKNTKEYKELKSNYSHSANSPKSVNEGIEEAEIVNCSVVPNTEMLDEEELWELRKKKIDDIRSLTIKVAPELMAERKYINNFTDEELEKFINYLSEMNEVIKKYEEMIM